MIEIELNIGGKTFIVACEDNEEEKVKKAAELLNLEAKNIKSHSGSISESKLLLLSALIISDRLVDAERNLNDSAKITESMAASLQTYKKGEDQQSYQKIENLKMEGLIEKILTNLERFTKKSNNSDSTKNADDSNNSESNQPKLF
jgi:cell division protein ZapA